MRGRWWGGGGLELLLLVCTNHRHIYRRHGSGSRELAMATEGGYFMPHCATQDGGRHWLRQNCNDKTHWAPQWAAAATCC